MAIEEHYRTFSRAVTRQQVASALDSLAFERAGSWGGNEGESYEEVWAPADRKSAVNYVEDAVAELPFVCVRQPSDADLLSRLTDLLDLDRPEELLAFAQGDPPADTLVTTLYKIAITFAEYDPRAANLLGGAAARHPDPNVQGAALECIAYRAWPLMKPVVEAIAATSADDRLSSHAKRILDRWPK